MTLPPIPRMPKPALKDSDLMPFGEHKGVPMEGVKASYLLWAMEQDWLQAKWPAVYAYCKKHQKSLEMEDEQDEDPLGIYEDYQDWLWK